jgi:ABC-type uncharacterized transport system fused permease/ATPase subunit
MLSGIRLWGRFKAASLTREINLTLHMRQFGRFKQFLLHYLAILFAETIFSRGADCLRRELQLCWRRHLTTRLSARYFAADAYYHLLQGVGQNGMLDADQRITEDVKGLAESLATAIDSVIHFSFTGALFTWLVARNSGFGYAMTPWLYIAASIPAVDWVTNVSWSRITKSVKMRYSSYYLALQRVHQRAESIASLDGGPAEASIVRKLFRAFMQAQHTVFNAELSHGVVANFLLYQLSGAFAYAVSFSSAFSEADASTRLAKAQFDTFLYWSCLGAAVGIGSALKELEKVSGSAARVRELFAALQQMDQEQTGCRVFVEAEDRIEFEHVDVRTPTGLSLVKDLSFSLHAGSGSIMVTGHNG